jgi:hypothetical protein
MFLIPSGIPIMNENGDREKDIKSKFKNLQVWARHVIDVGDKEVEVVFALFST